MKDPLSYEQFVRALAVERMPLAAIDLAAFDRNLERCRMVCAGSGKRLRVATKSVRCPALLTRIRERLGEEVFGGLMCASVPEAALLFELGFRDLLVAYPAVQPSDMKAFADLHARGASVRLVCDCEEHLDALGAAGV
ncbi:MAG: alanine racemase, partial [Planctomycetota bacterium]